MAAARAWLTLSRRGLQGLNKRNAITLKKCRDLIAVLRNEFVKAIPQRFISLANAHCDVELKGLRRKFSGILDRSDRQRYVGEFGEIASERPPGRCNIDLAVFHRLDHAGGGIGLPVVAVNQKATYVVHDTSLTERVCRRRI